MQKSLVNSFLFPGELHLLSVCCLKKNPFIPNTLNLFKYFNYQ